MPWSLFPCPWWLWLLVGVWAGVWVFWQRGGLTPGWQRAVFSVGVIYTVLILSVSTRGVTNWSLSVGLFWCASCLAVAGSLLLLMSPQRGTRRWGTWLVSCGTAGMLVFLDAEFAAALALICGTWQALRPITEQVSPEDIAKGRVLRLAPCDRWLLVVAITLSLTSWLGVVRQAAWREMPHLASSDWITVQPRHSRFALESKRAKATDEKLENDAPDPRIFEAETIGLGAILLWTCYRLRSQVSAP